MNVWWATAITLLMSGRSNIDLWPQHGYFQVTSSRGSRGETVCQLEGSARIYGEVLALVIRGTSEEQLEGVLMSPRAEIGEVERVVITLDGEGALWFRRAYAHKGRDLTSVVGLLEHDDSSTTIRSLRDQAADATWFGVSTSAYTDHIPATGLKDALDDLSYCLQPLIP